MHGQIGKWGNSLALRIPGPVAREIEFREGRCVDITVRSGTVVITPVEKKYEYELDELLGMMTDANRHGEVETGRPVGEEIA